MEKCLHGKKIENKKKNLIKIIIMVMNGIIYKKK